MSRFKKIRKQLRKWLKLKKAHFTQTVINTGGVGGSRTHDLLIAIPHIINYAIDLTTPFLLYKFKFSINNIDTNDPKSSQILGQIMIPVVVQQIAQIIIKQFKNIQ